MRLRRRLAEPDGTLAVSEKEYRLLLWPLVGLGVASSAVGVTALCPATPSGEH